VIELENVRRSLNNYQHQLDGMHRRIEDKNQALWTMAHKDGLTGAYNRLGYDEDIASLVNAVVLQPVAVSLMLIDCDKFKAINDSHGHQVGDEVLITLVKLIQSCLRAADKLYRIGGDEFVVVLTNTDAEYSEALGQRFLAAVAECDLHLLALSEPLTISIGIAHALVGDAQTLTYLHKCADQSMYQAKQQTAPKLVVCDVAMT
jgi:diguanylate cyclase (GGDEF)-like protein